MFVNWFKRSRKAYNPFSATSKKMIKDVGNVELSELFETDPKVMADFGQTDFGQTDFGRRLWPKFG